MATQPRVLISDKMSPRAEEVLKKLGIDVDVKAGLSAEELSDLIKNYDGLVIRSSTKVTDELIEASKGRLRVVGRAGVGVDNVDVNASTKHGVVVMNTPFGNSTTTAEHTIAMIMSIARFIPQANASTHAGEWNKSKFTGMELTGKTLGVIGCGNIGSIVANRALGLKMKVLAYDPLLTPERAVELGVVKVELDDVLKKSDIITVHVPLIDQTRGIIDAAALAKTKKGVRIVNCARGGVIVEKDLKEALDNGHVAGAALDVFEIEPAKENIFFGHEKVICTPHLGSGTVEAQENVALQVAEQVAHYLLSGAVSHAINLPSVSAEDAPKLHPYMKLAEQLGGFAGQIARGNVKELRIQYEGHAAGLNVKPLTALVLAGFLSPSLETVNMVSAPLKAKERGISLSEVTREQSMRFHTLIRLSVITDEEEHTISGTIFGDDMPRIVSIDGVPMEAALGAHTLFLTNKDEPGLIGNLGKALGEANINIANFHLGRIPDKNTAMALISVDQPINQDLMKTLSDLPSVERVHILKF